MGFKHRIEKGLSTIKDLYNEGTLMSFQQVNTTFPESTFLSTYKLEALYIPKLKPPWNLHCPLLKNSQLTIYMTEDSYQSYMRYC